MVMQWHLEPNLVPNATVKSAIQFLTMGSNFANLKIFMFQKFLKMGSQ